MHVLQQEWGTGLDLSGRMELRRPSGELKPESDFPGHEEIWLRSNISHSVGVYDYGQNASGIVKLTVSGKSGQG